MNTNSNTNFVDELMLEAKASVQEILVESQQSSRKIIARYTAAFAINFTDWIGRTLVWIQDDYARSALNENLKCETKENHTELLLDFAKSSFSYPKQKDHKLLSEQLASIRHSLSSVKSGGLFGLALLTTLENTSEIFIPDLAKRAEGLGSRNLRYTEIHGIADLEHSTELLNALKKEMQLIKGENFTEEDLQFFARSGMKQATGLLAFIYE